MNCLWQRAANPILRPMISTQLAIGRCALQAIAHIWKNSDKGLTFVGHPLSILVSFIKWIIRYFENEVGDNSPAVRFFSLFYLYSVTFPDLALSSTFMLDYHCPPRKSDARCSSRRHAMGYEAFGEISVYFSSANVKLSRSWLHFYNVVKLTDYLRNVMSFEFIL